MKAIKAIDIHKKVLKRLRGKKKDLDFMFDTGNGFEKWLQGEVALTFKDELLPSLYDNNWKRVETVVEPVGERIVEIRREFAPSKDINEKVDLYIVENPYLKELTYSDRSLKGCNNQLKCDSSIEDVLQKFEENKYHYVELKVITSGFSKNSSFDSSLILSDANKLDRIVCSKNNLASSLIAMGVVRLYYRNDNFTISEAKSFILTDNLKMKLKGWRFEIDEISEQDFLLSIVKEF